MQNKSLMFQVCMVLFMLLVAPVKGLAQGGGVTISGQVTDDMDVVIGATVKVVPGNTGTVTDVDGNFKLTVPSSAKSLVISYVGYKTKTVDIKGRTQINVQLKPEAQMLDEVVSIGYAKVKRKDLTGATASVNGKELVNVPVSSAAQALAGKAAGVNIISKSGAPGSSSTVTVRGGMSLTQGSEPLYLSLIHISEPTRPY